MPKTSLFLYSFSIVLAYCFKASLDFKLNYSLLILISFLFLLNLRKQKIKKKLISLLIFIIIYLFSPSYKSEMIKLDKELGRQELLMWICDEVKKTSSRQEIVLCFIDENINEKVISWWPLYPNFNYGDKLVINCSLQSPNIINDFDYPSFLASKGIYYTCSFPKLLEREENYKTSFLKVIIHRIKNNISKLVKRNLPEPQAGLVLAILLGERREMSDHLVENFRVSGIGHLTAVSGTHINLISLFLLFIFLALGLKKRIAFFPLIFILTFYVLLIGAKASAIRALLMSFFILIAWRNNRLVHPLSILCACASISLIFEPKLLINIGWQLSFTAVLGIILFMPYFNIINEKFLNDFPYNLRKIIRPLTLAFFLSLSVQLMIWPLLAGHFNYLSFLSVFTNILVFPIFSLLMFLIIPTIFISYFIRIIAWNLFSPIYFLTKLLIKIVELSSSISSLYIKLDSLNYFLIFIYYLFILSVYRTIKKQAINKA